MKLKYKISVILCNLPVFIMGSLVFYTLYELKVLGIGSLSVSSVTQFSMLFVIHAVAILCAFIFDDKYIGYIAAILGTLYLGYSFFLMCISAVLL